MASHEHHALHTRQTWRKRVTALKREIHVLYLALKHPNVPWYVKAILFLVVAYAVSPIDLIPDVVPVLGYLDDLILLPLGIMLAFRLIPDEVLSQCRQKAAGRITDPKFVRTGIILVIVVWILVALVAAPTLIGFFRRH